MTCNSIGPDAPRRPQCGQRTFQDVHSALVGSEVFLVPLRSGDDDFLDTWETPSDELLMTGIYDPTHSDVAAVQLGAHAHILAALPREYKDNFTLHVINLQGLSGAQAGAYFLHGVAKASDTVSERLPTRSGGVCKVREVRDALDMLS